MPPVTRSRKRRASSEEPSYDEAPVTMCSVVCRLAEAQPWEQAEVHHMVRDEDLPLHVQEMCPCNIGFVTYNHTTKERTDFRHSMSLLLELAKEPDAPSVRWIASALLVASQHGHAACVQHLLDAAAGMAPVLDLADASAQALFAACQHGHAPCVKLLLEAGARTDAEDAWGLKPLYDACAHGAADCVRLLLDARAEATTAGVEPDTGLSALAAACTSGHVECARLLLEAGADPDERELRKLCDDGQTHSDKLIPPLVAACRSGQRQSVRLLLEMNAHVDICIVGKEVLRITPLIAACWHNDVECAQLLIAAGCIMDLHEAVSGYTALHIAVLNGKVECARLLVEADADVNCLCLHADVRSPLAFAVLGEHEMVHSHAPVEVQLQMAQLLCAHGAECVVEDDVQVAPAEVISADPDTRTIAIGRATLAQLYEQQDGCTALSKWLRRANGWTTRLHHVELLTEDEAVAELRAGADVFGYGAVGTVTPLALAQIALLGDASHRAASAVVRAAKPWSPTSHHLFPPAARARAVELLLLGAALSASDRYWTESTAVMDVWVTHVMPHVLQRHRQPWLHQLES